jgi:hypothetical protein
MDFIDAGKSNFAPLFHWSQASSWFSVKFKRVYWIRHMILGWLECISNVGIPGSKAESREGNQGANRDIFFPLFRVREKCCEIDQGQFTVSGTVTY